MIHRYQAQVTLLTSLLRPIYGTSLEIGTVDGMQGREKDAVIISLVRSNDTVCFVMIPASSTFILTCALLARSRFPEGEEASQR
jgi:hypothetical protein